MGRGGPTQADPHFSLPRLARVYDALDPDRGDLDVYVAIAAELGARRVLDVGCGTGVLAVLLAERGLSVVGVDPASASVDVARSRAGGELVTWVDGDATVLASLVDWLPPTFDLVTMTANVAQVFVGDDAWLETLRAVRARLRPGGHLVFETRVVEAEIWREWTRERSEAVTEVAGAGRVRHWVELRGVTGSVVRFDGRFVFEADGASYTSGSTLRFRTLPELRESLAATGFEVVEVRDAPDRPGREWVVLARRTE